LGQGVNLKLSSAVVAVGLRTMDIANQALSVASVINFIALLLMLHAVIKNRNSLRGYSIAGSFLTFVSLVGFQTAYYLLGNTVGFILGWVSVGFWFIAFIYTLRQRLRGTTQAKETVEPQVGGASP